MPPLTTLVLSRNGEEDGGPSFFFLRWEVSHWKCLQMSEWGGRNLERGNGKSLCVISKKQKCQNTPLNPRYASEDEHVDSRDSQNLFQRSTLAEITDDGMLIACSHRFSVAYCWNTTKCLCVLQLSSVPSIVCPFKGPVCKILYHLMVRMPYCKQISVFYWSMFSLRPCCNANDETVIRLVG